MWSFSILCAVLAGLVSSYGLCLDVDGEQAVCNGIDSNMLQLKMGTRAASALPAWLELSSAREDVIKARVKKMYYINLEESTQRRDAMQRALEDSADGVPFERWPAVPQSRAVNASPYTEILREHHVPGKYLAGYGPARFPGMAGCYMSHRMLLRHINQTDSDPDDLYVVMEDDVNVKTGWRRRLDAVWPSIPDAWDVLKIGYWGNEWPCDEVASGVFLTGLSDNKSRETGCWHNYAGTQAYIVTPRSAGRILDILDKQEIRDIDQLLCTGWQCAPKIKDVPLPIVYALSDLKPFFQEGLKPLANIELTSALFLWDPSKNMTISPASLIGDTSNMTLVRSHAFFNGSHALVNGSAIPWTFSLNSSIGRLAQWEAEVNSCSVIVAAATHEELGCTPGLRRG